jgi:hypothetical protein
VPLEQVEELACSATRRSDRSGTTTCRRNRRSPTISRASFLGNYWGLVRPEFAWRGSVGILQQQANANQQAVAGLEGAVGFPTTGHPTQFLNTSHYFLSRGGQVGGSGALTQRTQMQSPAAKAPQGGARGAPATRP